MPFRVRLILCWVWDVFRVISEVQIDNDMFFFCSGVSVNVQDLAPSCAGALFGKF